MITVKLHVNTLPNHHVAAKIKSCFWHSTTRNKTAANRRCIAGAISAMLGELLKTVSKT